MLIDDPVEPRVARGLAMTKALLALPALLHASLSPDGSRATVTAARVPEGADDEVIDLHLIDLATGARQPLPGAIPGDRTAVWSPTGRQVAFLTDRAGETGLAVSDFESGQVHLLPGVNRIEGPPVWSPDGTRIVVPCRRGRVVDRTRPYRWTRPLAAFDGLGPLEDPPQLLSVSVVTDAAHWITDDDWRWMMPRWSPDGEQIAAVIGLDPDDRIGGQSLRLISPAGGSMATPAVPSGRTLVPTWLDDGRLVVLVGEPADRPAPDDAAIFVVNGTDVREVAAENLLGDVYGDCASELADVEESLLHPRGGNIIVRTGSRGRMGIASVNVDTGTSEVIIDGARACSPVALQGDVLLFTRQSIEDFPELAALDLSAPIAGERPVLGPTAAASRITVARFTVPVDSWHLDVWFAAPPDIAGPLPTVVVVHGGPHYTYGEAFSLDVHTLVAAGFGVVYTNPRGSTGYGSAFARAVHGDWADGPGRDILAVVDDVVARGFADPDRLGITGNSYGGYLSAWLGSTTDRFRAAVIENPVTDLLGMYGTSDIGRRFFPVQMAAWPHENIEPYMSQSPLLQAHRCRTPSLFVTGEADRRCPSPQVWAMHRVLYQTGTPSEVLVLPGSAHEGSTYGPISARLAHNEALVEWMSRWLLAEEHPATKGSAR